MQPTAPTRPVGYSGIAVAVLATLVLVTLVLVTPDSSALVGLALVSCGQVHDGDDHAANDETDDGGADGEDHPADNHADSRNLSGHGRELLDEVRHCVQPEVFESVHDDSPAHPEHRGGADNAQHIQQMRHRFD